jgi:hypothetical protein
VTRDRIHGAGVSSDRAADGDAREVVTVKEWDWFSGKVADVARAGYGQDLPGSE